MKKLSTFLLSASLLSACADHANEIPMAYVSPIQYRSYDCDQIAEEMEQVSVKVQQLGGTIDKKASDDSAQMAIGMVLFWPALFFWKVATAQKPLNMAA